MMNIMSNSGADSTADVKMPCNNRGEAGQPAAKTKRHEVMHSAVHNGCQDNAAPRQTRCSAQLAWESK